jgi:hypothetical protein
MAVRTDTPTSSSVLLRLHRERCDAAVLHRHVQVNGGILQGVLRGMSSTGRRTHGDRQTSPSASHRCCRG